MTLIELLIPSAWLFAAVMCGWIVGARFGVSNGLLAALAAFVVPYATAKTLSGICRALSRNSPAPPPCSNGTCHGSDYRYVKASDLEDYRAIEGNPRLLLRCGCGDHYRLLGKRARGRKRFVRVDRRGDEHPYMSRRRCGRWERED